jgi:hypothetical protein
MRQWERAVVGGFGRTELAGLGGMVCIRRVVGKKERRLFVDEMEIICMHLDGEVKKWIAGAGAGETVMLHVNMSSTGLVFLRCRLTILNFPIRKPVWDERLVLQR